jgi:hypothetical protein
MAFERCVTVIAERRESIQIEAHNGKIPTHVSFVEVNFYEEESQR